MAPVFPVANNERQTVKSALKQKKTKIVTYDWLEDSCMKKSRQSETKYLWKSLDKAKVKKKTDRKKATKAYIEEKKVGTYTFTQTSCLRCRATISAAWQYHSLNITPLPSHSVFCITSHSLHSV